jgi:hypothetical protein
MTKVSLFAALVLALPVVAEEPSAIPTPDKVEKAEAAKPAAAAPASADQRPYVDAAVAFMKGLAHSNRSGDAGQQGWAEAKGNSAEKVTLKVAGKEIPLDIAAQKSDARVVKFQKVSTMRENGVVKGVTMDNVQVQVADQPHAGKGTLHMEEKDGKWIVTSIEVE